MAISCMQVFCYKGVFVADKPHCMVQVYQYLPAGCHHIYRFILYTKTALLLTSGEQANQGITSNTTIFLPPLTILQETIQLNW